MHLVDDITTKCELFAAKREVFFCCCVVVTVARDEGAECVCLCVRRRRLGARATDENIRVSILGTTSGRHHYAPRL